MNLNVVILCLGQLVSPQLEQQFRASLPLTDDQTINQILTSKDLLFYTENEMPKCYQQDANLNGRATVIDVNFNISGDAKERQKPHGYGGNGNVDFPWRSPGGTDYTTNVRTFKIIHLPTDKSGIKWPIVWWDAVYNKFPAGLIQRAHNYIRWCFPVETRIFEILAIQDADGQLYTFEMRVRHKESDGEWGVNIFRPYPNKQSLANALKNIGYTKQSEYVLSVPERTQYFTDVHNNRKFTINAHISYVPDLPPEVVKQLLDVEFQSALGETWMPTSEQKFNIVPGKYLGAIVGTDRDTCAKCHENTGEHVTHFTLGRGWYGHIRGSDRIFSFHPFALRSIGRGSRPVELNQTLIVNGYLDHYNATIHPRNVYIFTQ